LQTVFLKGDESLVDFVPPYWKKIVQADFDVKRVREEISSNPRCSDSLHTLEKDFTCPEQKHFPFPNYYTVEARRTRVEGLILLSVNIDEDGNLKITDIIKPLGMGLDDNTITTIEKTWKYSPAFRDGVPVVFEGAFLRVYFSLLDSPKK